VEQTKRSKARSKPLMTRSRDADSSPFALLARAEALLQSRDAAAAATLARKILRTDRTHVGALEVLGRSLWQQQQFDELISITRRLIRLDPYNPGYHMLRGAAYQCMSMFGEATKAYARATASSNTQDADRSIQLIAELRDWQANLLSTLLEEDATFRAAYSRDPQAACQAKGFEFVETPRHSKWVREESSATILSRPS
jgi:tetratricopeptide (TPR) repeat protein